MFRQNFLQQLDSLKKEFDNLTSENNSLRTMLKKQEERSAFFHQEIKVIKNTIIELQSQIKVKRAITDDLPRQYSKTTKRIKIGSGWSVENNKVANIKLVHTSTLPTTIGTVEISECGNFIGLVCASSIFLFCVKESLLLYLNPKSNKMEEVTNSTKSQIIKENDFKILFSKDSKFIFTDNGDKCIRKWNLETKTATRHLLNYENVSWACYKENIIMTDSRSVIIYDLNNQLQIPFFQCTEDSSECFTSLVVAHEDVILLGSRNGKIVLLKGEVKNEFNVHSKSITNLAVNQTNCIISGSLDKCIFLNFLDLKTLSLKNVIGLMKHEDYVLGVRFFDDNLHFASCSRDSTFRIWDNNKNEMRICAHSGPVTGIAIRGNLFVSAGLDRKFRLWNVDFNLN